MATCTLTTSLIDTLKDADSATLKQLIGQSLTILRLRKEPKVDAPAATTSVVDKGARTAKREAEKAAYRIKKAAYEALPFGVQRADGKLLKRRFADFADAEQAAADLCVSMKTASGYMPVTLAPAAE